MNKENLYAVPSAREFGGRISAAPLLLLLLLLTPWPSGAEQGPQVLGYGVKGCPDYVAVFDGWEDGDAIAAAEYLRYRSWLTGFVTGLSLATASDVLKGVEVKGAMRRIQVYCDDHPDSDFFMGTMDLVRILSGLGG